VAAVRSALPEVAFAVDSGTELAREPGYRTRFAAPPEMLVADVEELVASPVAKILARHDGLSADELHARVRALLADLGDIAEVTFSGLDGLLEIGAAGVTKAFTLEHLATQHGVVARDVVAFGDMPNDLPMLVWAGWGVAVANAHADVLAAADEVTLSNDEDGVAVVVERLLDAE
jgi:hydroxymethylpyrimidine pyrophosphatase-like HAD family hydrolase